MHEHPAQHVDHGLPHSMTLGEVATLPELLRWRCQRSPEGEAYRQCEAGVWRRYSWREVEGLVARWPENTLFQETVLRCCSGTAWTGSALIWRPSRWDWSWFHCIRPITQRTPPISSLIRKRASYWAY